MGKKLIDVLNQPFVLWFLSSVIVGLVTWQYSEVQRSSSQVKEETRVLKKSNLELNLILQDVKFGADAKETLTAGLFNETLTKMQYNGLNPTADIYVPSLQNIMLEIDSRISSEGLQIYQPRIAEHIDSMSGILNRIFTSDTESSEKIWDKLSRQEQRKFINLAALTVEISNYYADKTDK